MSRLRRALEADAAEIAGVDVRAWWHAYASFLDERQLAERTTAQRTERWRQILSDGESETWVLEVAGRIAGYAAFGGARDDDAGPAAGELYALYVDPPAQGAGAGTRLLAEAERRLREHGYCEATLWTFSDNGLAHGFYERHGWVLDDAAPPPEECERWAPAVRFTRVLKAAAGAAAHESRGAG